MSKTAMSQQLYGPLIKPLRHNSRSDQRTGQIIDNLLPGIVERGVQAGDQRLYLFRWQSSIFTDLLVLIIRIGRMPLRVNQVHYDLSLSIRQRRMTELKILANRGIL